MLEQFLGDFTYCDSAFRQGQLFISFLNFRATSLLHLLYFFTYSGFKNSLGLTLNMCYELTTLV